MPLFLCPRCGEFLHNSRICKSCETNIGQFEDLICVGCHGILTRCPRCQSTVSGRDTECSQCGFDLKSVREKICSCCRPETSHKNTPAPVRGQTPVKPKNLPLLKRLRVLLLILTAVFITASAVFFYEGYHTKSSYYSSDTKDEDSTDQDTYQNLISGTYFTGYMVLGSSCMVGSVILLSGVLYLSLKIRE